MAHTEMQNAASSITNGITAIPGWMATAMGSVFVAAFAIGALMGFIWLVGYIIGVLRHA